MDLWLGLFKKKCTNSETEAAGLNLHDPHPHPLQFNYLVRYVLEFLPQSEIKSSRLVCYQWNIVAQPILRKRSKIVIAAPENFIDYNSKSHFVNLPFSSFLLSYQIRNWDDSDWQEFCHLWIRNIKSLELHNIAGGVNTRHGRMLMEELLCGTPLLCLAKNLVELRVSDCSTPLLLPLDSPVKILALNKCSVIAHLSENTANRITPWKVSLQHVLFILPHGNKLLGVTINDFVDFVNCEEIKIVCSASDVTKITYDTLRDVTSARKIEFNGIRLLGQKIFHQRLDYIKMSSSFFDLQDPDMEVGDITKCDCELQTKAIEKLRLPIPDNSPMYLPLTYYIKSIDLPNLKYLKVDADYGYVCSYYDQFPNVTDMEVLGDSKSNRNVISLYFFNIPRGVKRLKLSPAILFKVNSAELGFRALDVLILDHCSMIPFADADRIMKKIKPKVLVIILKTWISSNNVISFIHRNIHLERVVVKMPLSPKDSGFLSCGHEYYEFNNQMGKVLTEVEFNQYFLLNSD